MFGIATAGGRRGQGNLDWRVKALLFSLAALSAGAACGAVLGLLGSLVGERERIVATSLVAVAFAAAGLAQLRPRSSHWLPQRDCETAQGWLRYGAVGWAVLNGGALGTGFLSRIGFISWYAVPLASVAFGSAALGALIYGAYGGVRGFAVWFWLAWLRRSKSGHGDPAAAILRLDAPGKRLSAALVVMLGTATAVVVGV